MNFTTFLQIFILADTFLAGTLTVLAVQHARAHFVHASQKPSKEQQTVFSPERLPAAVQERLLRHSETQFQDTINASSLKLHKDLDATALQINKLVSQLGSKIIGDELERYRMELTQLRTQAQDSMGNLRSEIEKHESELKQKMADEVAAEKRFLIQQMDAKLADSVISFLVQVLGRNADLGAQTPYLLQMLNEHKAELTKEISDEI